MINSATHPLQALPLSGASLLEQNTEKRTDSLLTIAKSLETQMRVIRRTIHANPELAYQEFETAKLAEERLRQLGFDVKTGIAGTGLIADIGSGNDVVAIRAEMDAVEIDEFNQVAYRSRKRNIMHACGHDAHLATVLGAAEILSRETLPGRIRIIVQPAEESADVNGKRGAFHMIGAGALDGVKTILGLHVDATLSFGKIGVIENPLLELRNSFAINVTSFSNKLPAPLAISRILSQLLEAKNNNSWRAANLQISNISWSDNEMAVIAGSYSSDERNGEALGGELSKVCSSLFQDQFKLSLSSNVAEIHWHKEQIENTFKAARETLGSENVVSIKRKSWTKEFAEYANHAPASFFLLGTALPGVRTIQHTATFDLDEKALPAGAAVLAASALKILSS